MYKLVFEKKALHDLNKLETKVKDRIWNKLQECKEVYPMVIGKSGWNYLCKKHFEQERKRLKNKLPYCSM